MASSEEPNYSLDLLKELARAVYNLMDNCCEDHTLVAGEIVHTIDVQDHKIVCGLLDKIYGEV